LQQRYPAFRYRMSANLEECTPGRNKPRRRSPMSIARIRRDAGYQPAYAAEQAFEDFLVWRALALRQGWPA
jgi:nucleoside-diphosphate-sugar epimerase